MEVFCQMKRIAIIGSSGGNLFSQGGNNPKKLLGEVMTQANAANMRVSDISFVGATHSLDNIQSSTKASLYYLTEDDTLAATEQQSLNDTNELATQADEEIAKKIRNGEVDAMIVPSADPKRINKASLEAAAEKKIPIVGTGGTSMADIQHMGCNVVAVSGTTATTNRTRAISAITSLAKHFDIKYRPAVGKTEADGQDGQTRLRDRISIKSIMLASIPGFIAMALILALSQIPWLEPLEEVFDILVEALPVIVAVVAAKQVSGLDETGIVSGVVAGVLSVEAGIVGGIIGGILAGIFSGFALKKAFEWKIPGTTANIVAGGLSGLVAGLLIYYLLGPVALAAGEGLRDAIEWANDFNALLAGMLAGAVIWPALMFGVYHAAILPIILLEMEEVGMSFFGAVDMVGLVMVSAGITLANILSPVDKEGRTIATPGFLINMGFGTFVEAAYPFMFSRRLVMGTAIASATFGGLLVGIFGVRGTAYVPSVVAPFMSNTPVGFIVSMLGSMLLAMTLTLFINRITRRAMAND